MAPPHTGDHFSVTFADDSVKSDQSFKCVSGEQKMEKVHFPAGDKGTYIDFSVRK